MKFRVPMKETKFGAVVVNAENRVDAAAKAEEIYAAGAVHWSNTTLESTGISEEQECDP